MAGTAGSSAIGKIRTAAPSIQAQVDQVRNAVENLENRNQQMDAGLTQILNALIERLNRIESVVGI